MGWRGACTWNHVIVWCDVDHTGSAGRGVTGAPPEPNPKQVFMTMPEAINTSATPAVIPRS